MLVDAEEDLWKAMDERRRPQRFRQDDNNQSSQQSQYDRPRQQFPIDDRPYPYPDENARSQQ